MTQPVICEYIVQNEYPQNVPVAADPYPNMFILPKKYNSIQDVKLSEVINAFPLQQSSQWEYHLRFESIVHSAKRNTKVWLDLPSNIDVSVPSIDGKVHIKALRMPKGLAKREKPVQIPKTQSTPMPARVSMFEEAKRQDAPGRQSVPYEQRIPHEQPVWEQNPFAGYEKVFQEADQPTPQPHWDANPYAGGEQFFSEKVTAPANTFDIFQDSTGSQTSQPAQSQSGLMDSLGDLNFGGQVPQQQPTPPEQEKTRVEQVSEFFQQEQQKRDDWHSAQVTYDERLTRWIGTPNKNHVRVLLCTLPDILWPGHSWQRLGMQDVQEPAQVKSAFRKYILMLHPDKVLGSGDNDKIYISNRMFSAMTDAFNLFKKEVGMK